MRHFHHNHMILVDGKETYLLADFPTESGVALEISGPEVILLHEHTVTELDKSELKLDVPNSQERLI